MIKLNKPVVGSSAVSTYKGVVFTVWQHSRVAAGTQPFNIRFSREHDDQVCYAQLPAINDWESVCSILNDAISALDGGGDFWDWVDRVDA